MTKQFEPDEEAAKKYIEEECIDGSFFWTGNLHLEGQRHAASVLMPEIEMWQQQAATSAEAIVRLKERIATLESALDVAENALKFVEAKSIYRDTDPVIENDIIECRQALAEIKRIKGE